MMEAKANILLVDDNVSLTKTMFFALKRNGYAVTTAKDGHEAIAKVKEQPFAMIFMDIKMPLLDGVETYKEIKKLRPEAVVMMMTAYAVEDLVVEALEEGAYGIIYKPLDIEKVLTTIEEAIHAKKGALILVVDDDPGTCTTLNNILAHKGYTVSTTHTGEEAIAIVNKQAHDILFIDMKLPTINGLETYLAIRERNPKAVAIMITGYRQETAALVKQAIENDAYTCLYKPLDMEQLLKLVDEIWGAEGKTRMIQGESVMDEKPDILIIEDDESTRKTLTVVLGKKGYGTETASTGKEALERAKKQSFDVTLLDIRLPDMDGMELVAPLKELHPDLAVIVITGYASLETALQALKEGAADYITKPLDMEKVLEAIGEALEKQRLVVELRKLSLSDDLTGLLNRRGFMRVAKHQLRVANRSKREMLLLYMDFDHLKRINDALSHRDGDRTLIEVANVLKQTFRESDIIARIGGDEFVVLTIEAGKDSEEVLRHRLQEELDTHNAKGQQPFK
ncbi:response regulator, partial [Candidatus Bipolaricaulota bacterium]|nr:response regulator [Candidatus Bipolaricaulota bacterium]